jgi:hypothetical protein
MKIKTLIEHLLKDNDLEDEIIVDWFDKSIFQDWIDSGEFEHTPEEFDKAWLAIQENGQEELSNMLSHYNLIYDIRNMVLDEIDEMRKTNG